VQFLQINNGSTLKLDADEDGWKLDFAVTAQYTCAWAMVKQIDCIQGQSGVPIRIIIVI